MDKFDPKTEQQVWQRVRGQSPIEPDRSPVDGLLHSAREAAAAYRYLAASLSGKGRDLAQKLLETEQQTVTMLEGVRRMSGGAWERGKPLPSPKGQLRPIVEKCFHRSRKTVTDYTALGLDPKFGIVYRQLGEQECGQCAALAALMGELP